MKKKSLGLTLVLTSLLMGCKDNIGEIIFETNPEPEIFSYQLDEIGTFNFSQEYAYSTSPNSTISTSLKAESSSVNGELAYEVIHFKNTIWKYDNIVFDKKDTLVLNDRDYQLFTEEQVALFTEGNMVVNAVKVSDSKDLQGFYTGTVKIYEYDTVNDEENNIELYNVKASINHLNQLLLFPLNKTASFNYLHGLYIESTGEFSGDLFVDNVSIGSVVKTSDLIYKIENDIFNDTFSVTIGGSLKTIVLNLTKN